MIRAKAAIYAGFAVLAKSVGMTIADIEQTLIGGAFGQYINIEKAIQIGLLPDAPWDSFRYMGNTSVRGAYLCLLSREARRQIVEIASTMTYLELSADNSFFEEFQAAMFLPHTDESQFPNVVSPAASFSSVSVSSSPSPTTRLAVTPSRSRRVTLARASTVST